MLDPDDEHHLSRVLRIREGERVSVIDGAGGWRICEWRTGTLVPATEVQVEPAPLTPVAIAFPPLKGDRTELVVQKLTELGADRMVLLSVDRAVVTWGAKTEKALARLRRVAHEAAMQSRRTRLPEVDGLRSLSDVLAEGFVMAQWGGSPVQPGVGSIAVGPEGGWSPAELALASQSISLGPTILRAETAAISAGVLAAHVRTFS